MSNPDLPGPYWRDQDDADYGSGWHAAPESSRRTDSPWDDGGFWRDDRGRSSGGRSSGERSSSGRAANARSGDARHEAGERWDRDGRAGRSARESWSEMLAGRSRRGARGRDGGARGRDAGARGDRTGGDGAGGSWDEASQDGRRGARGGRGGHDRGGRFSQTADDLRSKLGIGGAGGLLGAAGLRGAAGSRGASGFLGGLRGSGVRGAGQRGGDDRVAADGSWSNGAGSRAAGSGRRSAGRAGARAAYGGDYGDYGDDRLSGTGSRTALREQGDDFWTSGGRSTRSRVTDLPGVRRSGRGGGAGGGGAGGGGGQGGGGRWNGGAPRSRGERFKNWLIYGDWWRRWTWKKVLLVLCSAFAAFVLLAIIGIAIVYSMTPIPTDVSQTATWQSSSVYFSNGQLLGTFTNSQDINRQLLTTSQIPQNVENAIIAAEDRNFYHEGGISLTGIMRAAYDDLFGSGGIQGGSTITEQYAKNYYANIGASRTITTKIKEIFVSVKLAHSRSKPWILTNYLNTVPFGPNVYGVWAAAEDYFSIDVTKPGATLSNAQAAMLAAMPNNPAVFSPDPTAGVGYTLLVQRWQYVLTNMVRDGAMSKTEATSLCYQCALPAAEQAFNKSVQLKHTVSSNGWTGTTGYLMTMVEQELESTYGMKLSQIETGGLRIKTTFSPSMMQALTRAVNTEKRQLAQAAAASGTSPLPYYDHFGISLENPKTGGIIAIYGGPGYGAPHCLRQFCDYNMAEAPHPVGSSMKPYVLAAAINQGMDVQTSVLNGYSPLWIPPDFTAQDRAQLASPQPPAMGPAAAKSAGWWESQGEASLGPISVSVAAAQSSDPAFTDLAHHVGVDMGPNGILATAQAFGVGANPFNLGANDMVTLNKFFGNHGSIQGSVQIALGQGDLTPIEQASTFATLIDGGVYHAPHVISSLSQWTPNGEQPVPLKVATHVVMSPAAAADEDYALSFDNINGTAYPNATWPGRPVIGKTGTLGNGSLASEAWFIGAIPQYAMAVGLWTNTQNQNLDNLPSLGGIGGSFGGAWPAALWKTFMTTRFANLPVEQLPTPNYAGFTRWVLALPKAPKQQNCQPGQGNGNGNGKKNQNCQPNPNPTPSCGGFFGQPCNSPSPSPTCGNFGQNCSPSPNPSSTCPSQGPPCGGIGTTAATSGGGLASGSRASPTLLAALSPVEEAIAVRARRPLPTLLL